MTLAAGSAIGRFEIVEPLGQGGMATVYKARQSALDRVVALKVIRPGYAEDAEFLERFRREARAVARLDHPNVVQVYDFDEVDGRPILSMQLLPGGTLKDRLAALAARGERMPREDVLRVVEQMAAGLAYAHEQGVVHRDVKPANVMFTRDGRAVVTDFGIARMLGGTQLTATGVGIGTPEYMSPEQGQGGELDARSDVYSLGVVAYELLTGRLPFTGDTPFAVVLKHVRDPLPSPTSIDATLPPSVDAVLARALAKTPTERYGGVAEMASALRDAVGGASSAGRTLPTVVSPGRQAAHSDLASRARAERRYALDRTVGGWLVALSLLGVLALDTGPRLAALAPSLEGVALPTISPSAAPTASATPRPVAFKPQELIMPPEQLPVSNYSVVVDEAHAAAGGRTQWRRVFAPRSPGEYGNIEFRLGVLEPGKSIRPSCDGWTWSPQQPTETDLVPSTTLGDRSVLCRFRFSDGTRWFVSWVAERNAEVITYLVARVNATDPAASDLVMSLAQRQLSIVAGLAPR